jgi:hypothetical protein
MQKTLLIPIVILLSFAAISNVGCIPLLVQREFKSISFYKSDEYNNTGVHRVLLVPFTFETNREKVINEVTEAFSIELQKSAKFDIVLPHGFPEKLLLQNDLWNKGLVRAETVIEAKKRFKVDAIIFGTITHYKPYEPPILGMKVGMFSTATGNVIWTADTILDSSEATVVRLVKTYYRTNYQRKQSLYGWKIILLSMKRYAQFAAHQVITTL